MTFLRWAGSKKQLGDVLSHCWYAAQSAGASGRYIEAFCGSASLFFRLKPKQAFLIDVNGPLIQCLSTVKSHPTKVATYLAGLPKGSKSYYKLRREEGDDSTDVKHAARFIYLNRFCFNGLYRTNASGRFNVPYGGGTKNGTLPNSESLVRASNALKGASLVNGDFFSEVITRVKKGDFVYLDPPYAIPNQSLDYQYGPDVFGTTDLERLFELLRHIEDVGAYFVLSYANCDAIKPFRDRWHGNKVEVQRYIAADSRNRQKTKEVLIANY